MIYFSVILLFSTLLLQWSVFAQIGEIKIKYLHLAILIFLVNFFVRYIRDHSRSRQALDIFKVANHFYFAVFLYTTFNIFSLIRSNSFSVGAFIIFKQIIYILMSVSLYYLIAGKEEFSTKLQKALYMGSLIGILSIIAWYFVSPEAILKISFGFFSGSENTVSTGFALLFKTLGESDTDNPDFSAAIRHEIASLLIVLAFILRFISVSFDKNISTNSSLAKNRRIIEFIVYIFVMIITFMTLSRQSILSGFFMVYYVIFMNSKTQLKILGTRLLKNNNFGIKILLFFIIILLVAALNFDSFLKLVSILYERFFEDTKAYDDRIGLNETALKLISENIFIGIGMGEKFSVGSREMLQIHNFFLATWIQSGIFGLISATYMHISLFLYCFYSSYHQYKLRLHEYSNHLNIEYVLALAFFPLMRSYYASNSFQSIVDWLTIGICLGFVELNKNIIHSKNMNASRSVKIQQEM